MGVFQFLATVKNMNSDQRVCCADAWLRLVSDSSPGVPQSCLGESNQCLFRFGQPEVAPPPLVETETGRRNCDTIALLAAVITVFLTAITLGSKLRNKSGGGTVTAQKGFPATAKEEHPTDKLPEEVTPEDKQARAWEFPFPNPGAAGDN